MTIKIPTPKYFRYGQRYFNASYVISFSPIIVYDDPDGKNPETVGAKITLVGHDKPLELLGTTVFSVLVAVLGQPDDVVDLGESKVNVSPR